jgi:hypothetical protein
MDVGETLEMVGVAAKAEVPHAKRKQNVKPTMGVLRHSKKEWLKKCLTKIYFLSSGDENIAFSVGHPNVSGDCFRRFKTNLR